MSRPITWQTVRGGDNAAALNLLIQSNQDLANAVQGVGGVLQQGVDRYVGSQTDQFLHALNQAPDQATRDQMIAEAKTAFLDTGRVNTANRAIISDERGAQIFANEMQRFANQQQMHNFALKDRQRQEAFRNNLMNISQSANSNDLSHLNTLEQQALYAGGSPEEIQYIQRLKENAMLNLDTTKYVGKDMQKNISDKVNALTKLGNNLTSSDTSKITQELAQYLSKNHNMPAQDALSIAEKHLVNTVPNYKQINEMAKNLDQTVDIYNAANLQTTKDQADLRSKYITTNDFGGRKQLLVNEMKKNTLYDKTSNSDLSDAAIAIINFVEKEFPGETDTAKELQYRAIQHLIGESENRKPRFLDFTEWGKSPRIRDGGGNWQRLRYLDDTDKEGEAARSAANTILSPLYARNLINP